MADVEPVPVNALLYPDLAEHGSLAGALRAVAAADGVELGEVVTGGRMRNVAASVLSDHGAVKIVNYF